jgi:cytochrome c-type biogenesis protein CcmH
MNDSLVRLEARLAAQGGTDADWELLAQTYEFMGRAADAQGARAHHLPGMTGSAIAAAPSAGPATPAGAGSIGGAQVSGAQVGAAQLDGVVEVATDLASKVPAGATLFIVAKAVGAPGPPVGVMRTTTGQWPVRFRLDDASAMVPGRTLSSAGSVTVEARVSRSGMATPQAGDFQSGVITVNPHDPRSVHLLIDHVIG